MRGEERTLREKETRLISVANVVGIVRSDVMTASGSRQTEMFVLPLVSRLIQAGRMRPNDKCSGEEKPNLRQAVLNDMFALVPITAFF